MSDPPDAEAQDLRNAEDWEDLRLRMRLGILGVPVALLHLMLISQFVPLPPAVSWFAAKFGYAAMVFCWANGAMLVFLHWCWTRQRMPVSRVRWLEGATARRHVLHGLGLVALEVFCLFLKMKWSALGW